MNKREWLKRIAAFGAAGASGIISEALAKGDLPPGVAKLEGSLTVNGRDAALGTPVRLGDKVATARGSQAVIVVGSDAFLMRSQTTVEFGPSSRGTLSDMLVSAGRVLSVFSKKPVAIKAATASIGIRGTGAYIEINPDSVYFCLCYGEAVIDGKNMPSKVVKTDHHESPLWLYEDGAALKAEPGPFLNHTDDELILLEGLVGREAPFVKSGVYPTKRY